jgi:hypothetical protein
MKVYDFCKTFDGSTFQTMIDFRVSISIEDIQDCKAIPSTDPNDILGHVLGRQIMKNLEDGNYVKKNGYRIENGKHVIYRDGVYHSISGPAVFTIKNGTIDYDYANYFLFGSPVGPYTFREIRKNIPLMLWNVVGKGVHISDYIKNMELTLH